MKVLVIAPHPDDEAIGPGGLIIQHVNAGDEVGVLYLTQGERGCPGMDPEDTATLRIHEGFEASKILGSTVIGFWKEPDGDLVCRTDLVQEMAKSVVTFKPGVIYVTHGQDSHPDHRNANQIVKEALEKSFLKPDIWEYEVWTPIADYDMVNDITDVIGIKLRAIRRHESQVARIRFDEAALSLARFRGELHNRPYGPYAEVYKRMRI